MLALLAAACTLTLYLVLRRSTVPLLGAAANINAGLVIGAAPRSVAAVVWVQPSDVLTWLDKLPFPAVVYSTQVHGWLAEHPSEVGPYLDYMCRHYDALPDVTLFLRGSDAASHQQLGMMELVARLERRSATIDAYRPLGTERVVSAPIGGSELAAAATRLWRSSLSRYFRESQESYSAVPSGQPCCGNFVVTAARIRSRPQSLYCGLLEYMLHDTTDTRHVKEIMMNRVWPLIFSARQ